MSKTIKARVLRAHGVYSVNMDAGGRRALWYVPESAEGVMDNVSAFAFAVNAELPEFRVTGIKVVQKKGASNIIAQLER